MTEMQEITGMECRINATEINGIPKYAITNSNGEIIKIIDLKDVRKYIKYLTVSYAIKILEKNVPNHPSYLPEELFYYVSKIVPSVNIDLLIKDNKGKTLLAWRNDEYCGRGWHIPGGVVRINETLETRVKKVIESEIVADITDMTFDNSPIMMTQFIHPELKARSHSIAFLYKCYLPSSFNPEIQNQNKNLSENDAGYLKWHETCPDNLIPYQNVYRKYITGKRI